MIIDIHDVWDDARITHHAYFRGFLKRRLRDYRAKLTFGPQTQLVGRVRRFIGKNLRAIIEGDGAQCIILAKAFDGIQGLRADEWTAIDRALRYVFNYEAFRDEKVGWGAYALCQKSRYRVCPYCHLEPTETRVAEAALAGYRPQLDHVLSRQDYPFLAVSLGNLVPACATCNGPHMKHATSFLDPVHLHPLVDLAVVSFGLAPAAGISVTPTLLAMREASRNYQIVVDTAGVPAAQASITTFQLVPRYQPYLHDAYRLAKVGAGGRTAYVQSVLGTTGLHISVEEELGFDPVGDAYKNVPQGRMRLDIYRSGGVKPAPTAPPVLPPPSPPPLP